MIAYRIATDAPKYSADDITGAGAKITGGRWNSNGVPMLYAASSVSLAVMETLVHLPTEGLPLNRFLVKIVIPDAVWDAREIPDMTSLGGWDALPPGMTSISFGDAWVTEKRSAILVVPSVVVPEEHNILLNPKHPDMGKVKAQTGRKWIYDPRLG